MNWIIIAFEIAIVAWVYTVKLTEQDMLLGSFYGYISGIAARKPWTEWFLKPLILCTYCVAGQMALWVFILYGVFEIQWILQALHILFFLSITLVFVHFINKIW